MLHIDLYAEITCPWCFVGLHRLDKVLKEHFGDVPVDIRHPRTSSHVGNIFSNQNILLMMHTRVDGASWYGGC